MSHTSYIIQIVECKISAIKRPTDSTTSTTSGQTDTTSGQTSNTSRQTSEWTDEY